MATDLNNILDSAMLSNTDFTDSGLVGSEITLTTPQAIQGSIPFAIEPTDIPQVSDKNLDVVSKKYSFASGGEIPQDVAKLKLQSGAESDLQQWMAYKRELDMNKTRKMVIEQTAMAKFKEGDRIDLLNELAKLDLTTDPKLAYAEEFAAKAVGSIPAFIQSSTLSEAAKNPEALDRILSFHEQAVSKREVFGRLFLDFEDELKRNSFFGGVGYNIVNATIDTAKLFIPGLSWYRFKEIAAKNDLETSYWKSNNIENVIQKIYSMPLREGYAEAKKITADLMQSNSYDALTFMQGLQSYGSSDRFLNDAETILDATVIGGAGLRLYSMLKGAHKAFGPTFLSASKLAEATGDLGQAARLAVTEDLVTQASVTGNVNSFRRVLDTVPRIFDPESVLTGSQNLSAEATARLKQSLNSSTTAILEKIANSVNVQRLDDVSPALAQGLVEAEQYIRSNYKRINDAIIDVRPVSADAGLANIAGVEARVGQVEQIRSAPTKGPTSTKVPNDYESLLAGMQKNTRFDPNYAIFDGEASKSAIAQGVKDGTLDPFTQIIPRRQLADGTWIDSKEIHGYRLAPSANVSKAVDIKSGIEVVVGTKAATLFDSAEQATNHAKNFYSLKDGSFTVKAEGDKYYISIFKQVDESSPTVRAQLATDLNQPEPKGIWNFIGRRLGATEDIMGNSMSTARKTALFQSSDLLNSIAKVANDKLGTLRKESRQNLYRFIDDQRRFENGDEVGKFSNDIQSFETDWKKTFGKYPSEKETDAYFHYTMLSDMDWTINNTNLYTQKALQGYRSFALNTDKVKMKDLFLDGKLVDEIPNIDKTYPNVIVWSNKIENTRTIKDLTEVQQWLDQGYRIIKLSSNSGHDIARFPGLKPQLPKGRIDYVLTNSFDEGPLRWDQLAYRPGGHRLYTDDWYVSSAKVFTGNRTGEVFTAYAGDFNLASARTKTQAEYLTKVMDRARELLRAESPELSKYIADNFPTGLTEEKFRKLYTDDVLNINEPFRIRRSDTTIADVYQLDRQYPNFVDQTKSGHHMDEGLVQYSSRRSQLLGAVEGSPENPLVRIGDGRLLDPLETMNKAINSIARNAFMEDVRIKHSTEYLARFGDILDIKDPLESTLNPFKYLLDGKFKEGAIDPERLAAAKAYRRSALEFLGIHQETDTAIRTIRDKTLDTVFRRFGERGVDIVEPYLLHRVNDPFQFFRSLAFHKNIGLFNWSSYITQMMQFTTIAGISGGQGLSGFARAGQGLAWGVYQRMLPMASESVQKAIIERAGRWGSNFQEAHQGWLRSGLATVGGEVAYLDDFVNQKVIKNAAGTFLDLGRTFFDAGERHARQTAWNVAYLDWRAANPKATMTDSVIRELVQRTDLLTGNMTRASQSYWQRGAMSLPVQFNTWQIRMTEQMFGDRLTRAEKNSLIMLNSLLYGIPTGLNTKVGPISMVRWQEGVTEWMRNRGVEVQDSKVMDLMMNGIMPHIMEFATGDRWNVGQKYGPPSKNFIKEALYNDEKSWLAVTAGAAGDAVNSMFKVTQPLLYTLKGLVGSKDDVYPLTFSDFKERITKLLPTLDMADRAYLALSTGQYISRNNRDRNIAEIDQYKGWLIGLLGLTPDKAVQAYDKLLYLKNIKDTQDKLAPEIQGHLLKALKATDEPVYHDNMKQAKALLKMGQFTPAEESNIIHRTMSQNADLVDTVNKRLAERGLKELQMYYRELERNKK